LYWAVLALLFFLREKEHVMKPVALITGASRGLGATLARLLARRRFDLVIGARGPAELERIAIDLRATHAVVHTKAGDVSDPATRQALVETAASLGGLNLLVNNASELGGLSPLAEIDPDRLERVLRVNLVAPLALIKTALPLLSERRGTIVNISSDAAQGGYPGWGVYGSSKAALDMIGRTLATELTGSGVAVVTVDPGDMRTRMHQEAFPGEDISDRPLPEVTLPFWEWLLDQDGPTITGKRFRAQEVNEPWAVQV
jgi:NAD(P)-dependent dehydrogenase (short-subunit alcohol dehydrogenase family)